MLSVVYYENTSERMGFETWIVRISVEYKSGVELLEQNRIFGYVLSVKRYFRMN